MQSPDLKPIRQREAAATKGPWFAVQIANDFLVMTGDSYDSQDVTSTGDMGVGTIAQACANAKFMAHAREDIPTLLAYIESLRAELSQCQKERTDYEVRLNDIIQSVDALADLMADSTELLVQDTPVIERLNAICNRTV